MTPAVRQLGLGLAALGRPGYINLGHGADVADTRREAMERAAHAVLDAAYEGGVRAFDAARSYGRRRRSSPRGSQRRGARADDVVVSSKWGYAYTAGWRVDAEDTRSRSCPPVQLRRQWAETRELLGDHIRLYQIHSATVESGVLDDAEVRAELAALRDAGVLVGLTATGPSQAATIERALEVGGFDAVQATWNLHERSAEPSLARAHGEGLRVYVKEALANGRLTARGASGALAEVAGELGVGEDAVALAAALAQPWADVVLSGAATVEQLRSNLRARDAELGRRSGAPPRRASPRNPRPTGPPAPRCPGTDGSAGPAGPGRCGRWSVRSPGSAVAIRPTATSSATTATTAAIRSRLPPRPSPPRAHELLGAARAEQLRDDRLVEAEPALPAPLARSRPRSARRRPARRTPRRAARRGGGCARGTRKSANGRARSARKPSSWTSISPVASTTPGTSWRAAMIRRAGARRGCQAWMPHMQPAAGAGCPLGQPASSHSPPAGQGTDRCGPASASLPASPTTVQVRSP